MIMTTNDSIARVSFLLVGAATATICLHAVLRICIPFPISFNVDDLSFTDHLVIWICRGLGSLRMLAYLLLAGWIGQLLQKTSLGSSRFFRSLLIALSTVGLGLYVWGSYVCIIPTYFLGGIMVSAITMGFLLHPERIKQHDTVELIALAVVLAFTYIAMDNMLERHRWTDFPAMLAFVYFIILLAYAPEVQRLMNGHWVKSTIITLSILSFIDVVFGLTRSGWMNIFYLLPVWAVAVQPVIIYPFILLWQKKHKNDDRTRSKNKLEIIL